MEGGRTDTAPNMESTNRLLKYFSSISQKFEPLNIEKLPLDVQRKLNEEVNSCDIPAIQPYQIYDKMKGCKKTKSAVPGELPARLRQVFDVELSEPAAILFNNIAQSGCWPQSWKNEYSFKEGRQSTRRVDVENYFNNPPNQHSDRTFCY